MLGRGGGREGMRWERWGKCGREWVGKQAEMALSEKAISACTMFNA